MYSQEYFYKCMYLIQIYEKREYFIVPTFPQGLVFGRFRQGNHPKSLFSSQPPALPVQTPVLYRLRYMRCLDGFTTFQVRYRPAHLQYPVIRPGR